MSHLATHESAAANLRAAMARVWKQFEPPPDLTVSEWTIRNRIVPKGTSPRPGPFKPEKFQIQVMDVVLDPNVHEIVFMKSTQVGGSEVLNNLVGYFIDCDPKPMMMVQPTIDNAKDYGRKRITPMIQACPVLRGKIKDPTSRRSGNTLALKEFPGGFLKLTGSNSGAGLRSDPVPIVLLDEIDAYPLDVEGEGDPISIATRRTDAYTDYKILKTSTPAKPKGISPVEREFERSDRRRFHVPCPMCAHMQPLNWRDPKTKEYRLYYESEVVAGQVRVKPESVAYVCEKCSAKIPERYKQQMLNAGEWIAEFPDRPVVGFHLNALYSPWRENWSALAQEWAEANHEKNPEKLKAFVNLRLGETWEEQGDAVEAVALKQRLEKYDAEVPFGVGLLTAAVDVQGDRLECVVKGWGAGEESWLIAYQQIYGDPGARSLVEGQMVDVWSELDEYLASVFETANGHKLSIACTMIDSGGQHTDSVYRFVAAHQARRIFALKGSSEGGKEIVGKFSTNNRYRVKLFPIGTDTAKDRIFARLKIPAPGPGYVHLPDSIEDEYIAQLTAEKAVRRYKKGRGTVREYIKTRARNEALDLEVYSLAALYVLGPATIRKLGEMAEKLKQPPEEKPPGGAAPSGAGAAQRPRGSNWVQRWR